MEGYTPTMLEVVEYIARHFLPVFVMAGAAAYGMQAIFEHYANKEARIRDDLEN